MVDDDDGDESPSPEPRMDSRSALPREIMAWRRLRVVKRDETSSLIFFPRDKRYRVGVEVGGGPGGPRDRGRAQEEGARPLSRGQGVGPLVYFFHPIILINSKKCLRGFSGYSENFPFLLVFFLFSAAFAFSF